MDCKSHLEKKSDREKRKRLSQINACEQKQQPTSRSFVQTTFSHSPLKLERKHDAAKLLEICLHFLFWRNQNNFSKNFEKKIEKKFYKFFEIFLSSKIENLTSIS